MDSKMGWMLESNKSIRIYAQKVLSDNALPTFLPSTRQGPNPRFGKLKFQGWQHIPIILICMGQQLSLH